ncbi:hypothetical protein HPO96_15940 [Kribbella sandramycini]|uniref:Uncharacterized protein n=1 Tax=Kribbella sandramycini TaxID=60450 RepID=A0A7Y4KZX6_9ACTN|nr:hypothetical protein [Kribbella sandramycini]MBB6565472.1 hypothetical protein [Kribbella sandramycini]NOL41739.1 hypothetical protein [Kribbella sandramycini]
MAQSESEVPEESDGSEVVEPKPDPERAQQTTNSLYWVCAAVSLLVGVFQYSRVLADPGAAGVLGWVGLAVVTLLLLGLAGLYVLCALERVTLKDRVLGRFDLFQVSTLLLVVTILVAVLIPPRSTTALSLLLPWGIGYWLYHLVAPQPDGDSSAEV